VSIAFEIVNYRYNNHLPTIVSTEKTPEELLVIDEATASRIIERAKAYTLNITRNPNRNYRLRNVVSI
jgi:DNA replication protein DnaC